MTEKPKVSFHVQNSRHREIIARYLSAAGYKVSITTGKGMASEYETDFYVTIDVDEAEIHYSSKNEMARLEASYAVALRKNCPYDAPYNAAYEASKDKMKNNA